MDIRLAEVHAEFIGVGGVSVIVASRNARLVPSNVRGIACRVSADPQPGARTLASGGGSGDALTRSQEP